MVTHPPAAGLATRLYAECDALKAFVALLETEQQILVGAQTEQLLALSEQKTLAVQELSGLAQERRSHFVTCGVKGGANDITAWLQNHDPDNLPAWQEILQLAERMRQINDTNGILIQSKLRQNQQALIVLHNAASHAGALYGRDGQHHLPTLGRPLGSG
jgi:flagella synthesis protein FlgN